MWTCHNTAPNDMEDTSIAPAPFAANDHTGPHPFEPKNLSRLAFADTLLGRLPGEMRNRIYHYIFHEDTSSGIELFIPDHHRLKRNRAAAQSYRKNLVCAHYAITQTCRDLRAETLSLMLHYASHRLTVTMAVEVPRTNSLSSIMVPSPKAMANLRRWAKDSGLAAVREIQQISLQFEFKRFWKKGILYVNPYCEATLKGLFHRNATFEAGFKFRNLGKRFIDGTPYSIIRFPPNECGWPPPATQFTYDGDSSYYGGSYLDPLASDLRGA